MKIAILTCEKLPDLNPEDQNIITELAKHIDAKTTIWDDKTVSGPTLII
jgi:hypothetical protein